MEVTEDGEAVVGCPAQDVRREDPDEDHHRFAATAQPLPNLLRLKTGDVLEPELFGNAGVAHGHDNYRGNKLHGKNKQEVGLVVGLLVHGPDLGTEELVSGGAAMGVGCHRGKVGRGDGYQNGNNPDSCDQAVGCLVFHARPQRMDNSHVPAGTKTHCDGEEAGSESLIQYRVLRELNRIDKSLSQSITADYSSIRSISSFSALNFSYWLVILHGFSSLLNAKSEIYMVK